MDAAQKQWKLALGEPRKINIREVFFSRFPEGSEELGSWGFREGGLSYAPFVGEAVWCRKAADEDPVWLYLGVRLASGDLLEMVKSAATPGTIQLFARGRQFGSMIKLRSPFKTGPWWLELFTRQDWLVSLHDQLFGEVGFQYPVGNDSRIWIESDKHPALPINLGNTLWDDWNNLAIPHDSPLVQDPDLQRLHFLLSVFFRSMFSFDFRS